MCRKLDGETAMPDKGTRPIDYFLELPFQGTRYGKLNSTDKKEGARQGYIYIHRLKRGLRAARVCFLRRFLLYIQVVLFFSPLESKDAVSLGGFIDAPRRLEYTVVVHAAGLCLSLLHGHTGEGFSAKSRRNTRACPSPASRCATGGIVFAHFFSSFLRSYSSSSTYSSSSWTIHGYKVSSPAPPPPPPVFPNCGPLAFLAHGLRLSTMPYE